jgi:hypothetical protein
MTKKRHPARFLVALILALGAACSAQARRYQVELLLFLNGGRGNKEALPEQTPAPSASGALLLQGSAAASQGITLLGTSARTLGPGHYTLDRSGRYQTLLHLVWRQVIGGRAAAPRLYFQVPWPAAGDAIDPLAPPPRLAGTLRMSRGRFLHAELDLVFRERLARGAPGTDQGEPVYRVYRMQEKRRMRSGELNYLDHPALGALIRVTPLHSGGGTASRGAGSRT